MTSLTRLTTEPYRNQEKRWPKTGRHILAQFDAESIVVYQAYNPTIGQFAAQQGYFEAGFNFARMSWIKPNFLWMMYRCGWGKKQNQEIVLAVHIARSNFEQLLADAVYSSYVPAVYKTEANWQQAVSQSSVRLQWDPDHHPSGAKLARRAIQLGMRGLVLAAYAKAWILGIEDISAFVREQYVCVAQSRYDDLSLPREDIYPVDNPALMDKLGLHSYP